MVIYFDYKDIAYETHYKVYVWIIAILPTALDIRQVSRKYFQPSQNTHKQH